MLTNRITIITDHRDDRQISGRAHEEPSDLDGLGGLEDEDETKGTEHDMAVSSPIKGKLRLTSTVRTHS